MNKNNLKNIKLPLILLLSFAVPLLVMCVVYFLRDIQPFGDTSIMIWDSKLQYKDYFGYLWDILHGDASFEYSASKSLGGQTIGLVAYYLTCPLNLLLYFIDKSQISLFIAISTLLKIAFSGLTSAYFINKRFKLNSAVVVLLSSCYALMEYNIIYGRNLMWLDGVVILPLACLGVYELLYNRKKSLLFFSVFIAIFSNWYSGYMVCLMTGFYFLYELILKYDIKNIKNELKKFISDLFTVAADMVLGVLASGALLIPALLSLVGGKAKMDIFDTTINVGILEALKGFDINAQSNAKGATILYTGAIVLILAVYLILSKKTDIKKRICAGAFFVFMMLCFSFRELDIMWTAFVKSNSYNYRWAFVFGFLMVTFAADAVSNIKKYSLDLKTLFKSLGIILAMFLVLDLNDVFESRFVTYAYLFAIIGYVLIIAVSSLLKNKKALKTVCLALVFVLTVGELTANAYKAHNVFADKNSVFADYVDNMENVIDEVKSNDDSFYRLEKTVSYLTIVNRTVADSESFMFGYNGIENYTSTYDANVDEFMARMGYSDSTNVPDENSDKSILNPTDVFWNSPMLLTDSLLGIKYQILDKDYAGLEKIQINSEVPNGFEVYKNNYALGLAYNVSSQLKDEIEYSLNPFENQEAFVNAALGYDSDVYIEPNMTEQTLSDNVEKITFETNTDGPVYFYTDGSQVHENVAKPNCTVYVNGEMVQNICNRFEINALYLGDFNKGETVEVEIKHESGLSKTHTVYLAQLDMNNFENAYSALTSGYENDLNINKNVVSGTYTTDTDSTVMVTLPYTEGWTLYVDGVETEYSVLGDTFIGFDLSSGTHEIEMKYSTLHKNAGIAASVIGFGGFAAWCVLDILKKRKNSAVSK